MLAHALEHVGHRGRTTGDLQAHELANAADLPGQRFDDLEQILPFEARDAIVNGYTKMAGFATEQVS